MEANAIHVMNLIVYAKDLLIHVINVLVCLEILIVIVLVKKDFLKILLLKIVNSPLVKKDTMNTVTDV